MFWYKKISLAMGKKKNQICFVKKGLLLKKYQIYFGTK